MKAAPLPIPPHAQMTAPSGQGQQVQIVQSNVFPPEMLEKLDHLVPGTAARMIQNSLDESLFRRHQEDRINAANIETQKIHMEILRSQTRWVAVSDGLGQVLGFCVCGACIVGAVYLGTLGGSWEIATALCAIPTAAVILAFRNRPPKQEQGKK